MISRTDVYLHGDLKRLEEKELRALLIVAIREYGGYDDAVRALMWKSSKARELFDRRFRDYPGTPVVTLALDDVRGLSLLDIRQKIRRAVVAAFRDFGSGRELGALLGVRECKIRRYGG